MMQNTRRGPGWLRIGTRGELKVRDSATGETLEQPWIWIDLSGPGFFARLWGALKRSLWPTR